MSLNKEVLEVPARCPECGGLTLREWGPDNGYGIQLACSNCGYESDARKVEENAYIQRVNRKTNRREKRKYNRR
jgi:DNA-directed RNA polymerase subunit M/transcription elongation factor TFIIS